ncbi:phosphoglycerate mutase-like protein [Xylariaceae sp. FL0255]|nr:phosphoglycerate mutase-like protein [Xylariaceae sp. FL0255]
MPLETIYVVRHGFRSSWSVDPVTGVYTANLRSPTGIPTDPALTSHGVEQANDLAEHLLGMQPQIEQVYSSPYYRCLQTISPFVIKQNSLRPQNSSESGDAVQDDPMRIRAEAGFSEWYGRARFEHPASAPLSQLLDLFADLDADYASLPSPRRCGESIPELYERVASSIQAIISRSELEGRRSILICTHAAVVIILGRILTGKIPDDANTEDFGCFTCGLSVYRRQGVDKSGLATDTNNTMNHSDHRALGSQDPGSSTTPEDLNCRISSSWACEANSDCSFLRSGEERGWKFSGDESFIDFSDDGPQESEAAVEQATQDGQDSGRNRLLKL